MSNRGWILICCAALFFGFASAGFVLFGYRRMEVSLLFLGVFIAMFAYYLVIRRDREIIEAVAEREKDAVYDYANEEDEEDDEVDRFGPIKGVDYKQMALDVINRSKQTGVELIKGNTKFAVFFVSLVMLFPFVASQINVFVDTMWVSYLGAQALAGVGMIKVFYIFVLCIGNGIGIGGSIRISFYLGRDDIESAKRAAVNTVGMSLVVSLAMTVFFLVMMGPILDLMGAADAKDYAMQYALPLNICTSFTVVSTVLVHIMRAEGQVGKVTLAVLISVLVNLALDPVLMFTAGLGVAGAAWATSLSSLTIILIQVYMYRKKKMNIEFKFIRRFDRQMLREINNAGVPRTLEEGFSATQFLVQRMLMLAVGGTAFVTIQDTGFTYLSLLLAFPSQFGVAAITIGSAAAGMRDRQKMVESIVTSMNFLTVISVIASVSLYVFAEQTMQLFIHGDTAQYHDTIIWTARLYSIILPLYQVSKMSSYIMQVIRRPKEVASVNFLTGSIRMAVMFIPFLSGSTDFESWAWAVVIGYVVEFLIKVATTLYFYRTTDFHTKIAN